MKKFRDLVKEHFTLSEKEANGFIILCFFMLLVLAFPWAHSYYLDFHQEKNDLVQTTYFAQITEAHDQAKDFYKKESEAEILQPFDPNSATTATWINLGLPAAVADRIEKYRSKGGVFRAKADLLKIYGFPEEVFKKIQSLILLPDQELKRTTVIAPAQTAKALEL